MSQKAKHRVENILHDLKCGRINVSNAYHLICNIIAEEK